jgi:long-chain acyl-CoA synthetase
MNEVTHPWLRVYAELGLDWSVLPDIPAHTLSGYIRAHAKAFPDREALVDLGASISYRKLDQLADRFANLLLSQGCRRGDVLGIHLPNTPQYVVAFVAAARLGVVVTSISPLLTAPEIRHQACDASVKVLLTSAPLFQAGIKPVVDQIPSLTHVIVSGMQDMVPGAEAVTLADDHHGQVGQVGRIELCALKSALDGQSDTPVAEAGDVEQILYLQYTGGTTGLPKGAKLSSRNLFINNAQADVFYGYRVGEEVVASAFPLFHIGGAAVLFNALRTASTIILVPDPRNLQLFCAQMQRRRPTVIAAVPVLYQMLVAHELFRALDFSSLRIAVSGGAPFSATDIARLEALIGPGKFCEVYGMTETSPVSTLNPARRLKPGFVGIPVPGTEVRIVDTENGTCTMPTGEPGEIIASGPQVMHGYLNLPDASASALRVLDGRTWMFTGDIGFMDADGYVKVCDRSKDMLIVGGFKVFSVEIENKLLELPQIAGCAVIGRADPDRPGNEIVQLHVLKSSSCEHGDEQLRGIITEFCRANMAPYKVPKEILFRAAMPLTSVGKIDKKALRG